MKCESKKTLLVRFKDSNFNDLIICQDGYGIGDDSSSVAIDGCRQLLWHNASSQDISKHIPQWNPGDIIGSLIDFKKKEIVFTLNGKAIPSFGNIFQEKIDKGFFAGASFMSFQQCRLFHYGKKKS